MKNKTLGFTLTETLVAIVIGMISVAAAFSAYNYFNKSYASISQKAAISKSAREALSTIARDLRNTGYFHIDFVNNNCELYNQGHVDGVLIGIFTNHNRNNMWKGGKSGKSDGLEVNYSISVKDRKRTGYKLREYKNPENRGNYYLARDITINPNGNHSSRGCSGNPAQPISDKEIFVPFVEDFQVIAKNRKGEILFPVCIGCSDYENTRGGRTESKKNMKEVHTVDIYLTVRSPKEVYSKARRTKIQNGESSHGSNFTISADKYHRETFFVSVHTRNLATHQVKIASSGQSIGIGTGYNK